MDQNLFSDLIRELRQRLGLSQEKPAAKWKVSLPTINRWEKAKTQPDARAWRDVEQFVLGLGRDYKDLGERFFAAGQTRQPDMSPEIQEIAPKYTFT